MKHLVTLFTIMVLFATCNTKPKNTAVAPQEVDFGTIDYYPAFKSNWFHSRDILVWLPSDYDSSKKYAVLYMHDGQMLFDKTTSWNRQSWNVDSVAEAVQKNMHTQPFIVVSIDNHPQGRLFDYMPRKALDYIPEGDSLLAKYNMEDFIADNYLKFIVSELKPFIDDTYSTLPDRDHTFVMGSSMGGLISMYAVCEYPDVFGGAGCLSTHSPLVLENNPKEAVVWAKAFRDYLNEHLPESNSHLIYMDYGDQTIDAGYIQFQQAIDSLITSKGWNDSHFRSLFFPGHAHDEDSWESRLHIPMTFLLKQPSQE